MIKRVLTILTACMAILCYAQEGKRIETEGEVVCAKTTMLSFPQNGTISYVPPLGTLLRSPLVNTKGKIVKQGDLVASLDTTYYERRLKEAELRLDMTNALYNELKMDNERNLRLAQKNVISQKEMLHSQTLYKNAEYALLKDTQELALAQYELDSCHIYAPFSGRVEELYYRAGIGVLQGTNVIKLSMLSPVIIRIKLPQDEMNAVSLRDKINIYPHGSDTPSGGWFDRRYVYSDHLDLFVMNRPKGIPKLSKDQEKLKKVRQVMIVFQAEIEKGKNLLWISPDTLQKDNQGYYVYRAKDQCFPNPVPMEFSIEKVRVKPLDIIMHRTVYDQRALEDPGSLKFGQYLVAVTDTPLEEKERVVFQELGWDFKFGDKVKVEIIKMRSPK